MCPVLDFILTQADEEFTRQDGSKASHRKNEKVTISYGFDEKKN